MLVWARWRADGPHEGNPHDHEGFAAKRASKSAGDMAATIASSEGGEEEKNGSGGANQEEEDKVCSGGGVGS